MTGDLDRLDERMMALALQEARAAAVAGDVPVGAVVARGDGVLGRAGNRRERAQDPTAHAEILALREASAALESWHLEGCTLYVTLEPCAMCAGAMQHARIKRLVYGAADPKTGACGSVVNLFDEPRLNHHTSVRAGVLAEEASALLSRFFAERREHRRSGRLPAEEEGDDA